MTLRVRIELDLKDRRNAPLMEMLQRKFVAREDLHVHELSATFTIMRGIVTDGPEGTAVFEMHGISDPHP